MENRVDGGSPSGEYDICISLLGLALLKMPSVSIKCFPCIEQIIARKSDAINEGGIEDQLGWNRNRGTLLLSLPGKYHMKKILLPEINVNCVDGFCVETKTER